jgi:hypothetical protein
MNRKNPRAERLGDMRLGVMRLGDMRLGVMNEARTFQRWGQQRTWETDLLPADQRGTILICTGLICTGLICTGLIHDAQPWEPIIMGLSSHVRASFMTPSPRRPAAHLYVTLEYQ